MKKAGYLFALSATAALFVAGYQGLLHARQIGTNPTGASADQVCYGGSIKAATVINATEVCLDSSGNWIPTTDNTQNLGTAALRFNSLKIGTGGITNTGPGTVGTAGTQSTLNGVNATAPVNQTVNGLLVFTPTPFTLSITTTVPVVTSYENIISSGGDIIMASLPNISTATLVSGTTVALSIGSYLILTTTGTSAIIFQDNGTLAGSGLSLAQSTFTVTNRQGLSLILANDLLWHETGKHSAGPLR